MFSQSLKLTLLSFVATSVWAGVVRRQQSNPSPGASGSMETGWQNMPEVTDATAYPDFAVGSNTMPVYQTTDQVDSSIERAVIVFPGKARDCWYYWNSMNNALYRAAAQDGVDRSKVSIMAPCFFSQEDLAAGAAKDTQLTWGRTTWVSGHYNEGPSSVSDVSSYDVVDSLVSYYMDSSAFPNLKTLVIAGHSAGAQMTQRYALMRSSDGDADRLHYWVANPGSLLWLTEDRPAPNADCAGFDDYKYGLSAKIPGYGLGDFNSMKREGLVSRYNGRQVHYAWGTADDGPGDTRCQAVTQGASHLERGKNFVSVLESLNSGSVPSSQSVDWIEGVSHDNDGMMNAAASLVKLFQL
ncbi:hypothetical protein CYLTODRAFT_454068 [Cylindrobasidium torrendii FP15055 ss-10]|uniref:Alpha/beta-hydrolase n=1 Tax=Cylindrobasidium torrendii FP15055 ss-10 TaxID=1314674 RepID=A0A0D7BCG4_9AGAR|nr:hypothetical protein CYLTODRAFT_454068 [Cylindrobasidium torrendii FP15055 ss-10]